AHNFNHEYAAAKLQELEEKEKVTAANPNELAKQEDTVAEIKNDAVDAIVELQKSKVQEENAVTKFEKREDNVSTKLQELVNQEENAISESDNDIIIKLREYENQDFIAKLQKLEKQELQLIMHKTFYNLYDSSDYYIIETFAFTITSDEEIDVFIDPNCKIVTINIPLSYKSNIGTLIRRNLPFKLEIKFDMPS
ncbi:1343_t:CDS:2, partial [Dentiscutata heterogama]